jgi:hypothetical protein
MNGMDLEQMLELKQSATDKVVREGRWLMGDG